MSLWPRSSGKANVLLPWERRRGLFSSGALLGRHGIVIASAVALVVLLIAAFRAADHRARVRSTRASIAEVQRAIAAFRAEFGRCPRFVGELIHPPRATARFLSELPRDAWDHKLYVRCPAPHDADSAEVVSAGPSGSFADGDNIY